MTGRKAVKTQWPLHLFLPKERCGQEQLPSSDPKITGFFETKFHPEGAPPYLYLSTHILGNDPHILHP